MLDPNPLHGVQPQTEGSSKASSKATPGAGPKFRALLDQLQAETRGLQRSSEDLVAPEQLAGAVNQARTALEGARNLSEELLEAYRAAQQAPREHGDES